MYGLTSEAYRLAGELVDKAQVTIIDETLQMAMDLEPSFLKKNPNLQEVMEQEPLLSFKPLEQVLGEAQVIFFTPRLRRPSDETLIEAGSKLRDLARYLSKGVTLVNSLPTGPGGNSDNISTRPALSFASSHSKFRKGLFPRLRRWSIIRMR